MQLREQRWLERSTLLCCLDAVGKSVELLTALSPEARFIYKLDQRPQARAHKQGA